MRYKVFSRADLQCPFKEGGQIPDKYKTETAAKRFCSKGCCPCCAPLFWWVRVLHKSEDDAPWGELNQMVCDPNKIILMPMGGRA